MTGLTILDVEKYEIDSYMEIGNELTVWAHTIEETAVCPKCGTVSTSVHSYYDRNPRDLPLFDKHVQLNLHVRRFRCQDSICKQKTFAERLDLVASHQQRTERLTHSLREVAYALGGEAGAALLPAVHMKSSGDTLLRLLKQGPVEERPTPRVLGVDDWAICKGRSYGTILVDLETREPVELLPDRSSESLANWLNEHPGSEIVTRDRSTEYARGITLGAPQARQIADRWHLLLNMRQLLKRWVRRVHSRLRKLPFDDELVRLVQAQRQTTFPVTAREREASKKSRNRRIALYEQIQTLKQEGHNIKQIADGLRLHRQTARLFYYAESFPERSERRIGGTILDPYFPYLNMRLKEGCENGKQLWRDIRALGYSGSYQQVSKWLRPRRSQPASQTPDKYRQHSRTHIDQHQRATFKPRLLGSVQLAYLLVRKPASLTQEEELWLKHIRQDPQLDKLFLLVQRYMQMVCEQQPDELAGWLQAALVSKIAAVATFARGIQNDYDAVHAALQFSWSNGQVEGQVNRLKMIKRQMYGRASFELLRTRVLYQRRLH